VISLLINDFFVRAIVAGVTIAVVAAPLGCVVVWRRMAYFGEAIAQAGLIGVAPVLRVAVNVPASAIVMPLLAPLLLLALGRQETVPFDAILGLVTHAALAAGVLLASLVRGPGVDLMSFLFGDIFAITTADLAWILAGGVVVIALLARIWAPLLALSIHEELAAAEGIDTRRVRTAFIILLALTVALAMKIVGALLAIAFLIMPATASRPLARTPEQMVALSAALGVAGVIGGLYVSSTLDTQGGPSIVVVLSGLFALTTVIGLLRRRLP